MLPLLVFFGHCCRYLDICPIQRIAVTLASLPCSINLPAVKRGLSLPSWLPSTLSCVHCLSRFNVIATCCKASKVRYSPECVEGEFSEVRHEFILNTSPLASVAALCNKGRLTSTVITKGLGGVWGRPL